MGGLVNGSARKFSQFVKLARISAELNLHGGLSVAIHRRANCNMQVYRWTNTTL